MQFPAAGPGIMLKFHDVACHGEHAELRMQALRAKLHYDARSSDHAELRRRSGIILHSMMMQALAIMLHSMMMQALSIMQLLG